jgi:hypothetical protein
MPVFQFDVQDAHRYGKLLGIVPSPCLRLIRYSSQKSQGVLDEFRDTVKATASCRYRNYPDVVYNHSAEVATADRPIAKIDNSVYYLKR